MSSIGRTARLGRKTTAVLMAAGLTAGGLAFAPVSSAATAATATAEGRFLGGSIGGTSLDKLVAIKTAQAAAPGGPATATAALDLTALGALHLPLGTLSLPLSQVVQLGAVNQYAQANPDGSAKALSGAVQNSGAVNTGVAPSGSSSDATVELSASTLASLLGGGTAIPGVSALDTLGSLKLQLGAIVGGAAQAAGASPQRQSFYELANVILSASSPLLANVLGTLTGANGATGASALTSALGQLGGTLSGLLGQVPSSFSLHLPATIGADGITFDTTTGALTVNLVDLLRSVDPAFDINNLPPNTHLITLVIHALLAKGPAALTQALSSLVTTIAAQLVAALPPSIASAVSAITGGATTLLSNLTSALMTANTAFLPVEQQLFTPLTNALQRLLDVQVNVHNDPGTATFTETALQINLLTTAAPLLQANLGTASVTSGTQQAAAPPTTPAPPSGPTSVASAATAPLAFTGASVQNLWLVGLAALCLGLALLLATVGVPVLPRSKL